MSDMDWNNDPRNTRTHPLAVALRALRADEKISQAQLSKRTGISQRRISAMESGRTLPSRAEIGSIADALGDVRSGCRASDERRFFLLQQRMRSRAFVLAMSLSRTPVDKVGKMPLVNLSGMASAAIVVGLREMERRKTATMRVSGKGDIRDDIVRAVEEAEYYDGR